ncbi:hypothetical protein, partial [Actinophytocola sp.]|uniref:hypothetical protein n=1 Tax=Actinophytocola sp. TaxID=1872138 RepID=UPI003D6A9E95
RPHLIHRLPSDSTDLPQLRTRLRDRRREELTNLPKRATTHRLLRTTRSRPHPLRNGRHHHRVRPHLPHHNMKTITHDDAPIH